MFSIRRSLTCRLSTTQRCEILGNRILASDDEAAMPFFFGFISWSFPSGLVLYWIFQNVFSMIQQLFINRIQTELHPEDKD